MVTALAAVSLVSCGKKDAPTPAGPPEAVIAWEAITPSASTTAPGGATFREAHLIMELLHDSGLVSSIDLVELNPFLDERGRTATLMVDLLASLMGRTVMDRPTRSFTA